MKNQAFITKVNKRTALLNGELCDVFCTGGKTSIEFHNLENTKTIPVNLYSIDRSLVLFSRVVIYID